MFEFKTYQVYEIKAEGNTAKYKADHDTCNHRKTAKWNIAEIKKAIARATEEERAEAEKTVKIVTEDLIAFRKGETSKRIERNAEYLELVNNLVNSSLDTFNDTEATEAKAINALCDKYEGVMLVAAFMINGNRKCLNKRVRKEPWANFCERVLRDNELREKMNMFSKLAYEGKQKREIIEAIGDKEFVDYVWANKSKTQVKTAEYDHNKLSKEELKEREAEKKFLKKVSSCIARIRGGKWTITKAKKRISKKYIDYIKANRPEVFATGNKVNEARHEAYVAKMEEVKMVIGETQDLDFVYKEYKNFCNNHSEELNKFVEEMNEPKDNIIELGFAPNELKFVNVM